MQKTLHGKRYMHSRATVRIGRDKKRIRKINRTIAQIKRIDFVRLEKIISDAMTNWVAAIRRMSDIAQRDAAKAYLESIKET